MRKLATAAAVSLVLASGGVRALGLGDIEMRSALNQPMNAEIRLTSVQPGEADGMIVKLASAEAFQRAGIDRSTALTDLRFSVDQRAGAPVIRISSNKPVVEPFLNFLLEVDWPSGRMVREYTVLLDPPVFMTPTASSSASEQPAITQRNDTSLLVPTPIERAGSSVDGFEVEIVGSAVEINDTAVLDAEGGDVVSLDDLGTSAVGSELGQVELIDETSVSLDGLGGQGDVVALTDLAAPNTDAAIQFQSDQVAAADFDFEVEIVGTAEEVSDSFVAGVQNAGESEVVSLDAIDLDPIGSGGGEVTVQRGDTMTDIAKANAIQGVSAQQMMMALVNANQGAFINGNVNLVKAGAILRIPEANELGLLTQAQAVAQMSEQNQLWREYRDSVRGSAGTQLAANTQSSATADATQPDATDSSAETKLSAAAQRILDAAKDEATGSQELNIVADSGSTSTTASATADNSESSAEAQLGAINQKLQLAKEELASTRLEATDLNEQADELQSTAENQESLLTIRQQEVARLQEEVRLAKLAASEQPEIDTDAAGTDTANAASELLANANREIDNATDTATDVAANAVNAGQNALTAAGETLGEVELLDDTNAQAVVDPIAPPTKQDPWYMELLQKYGKWLVIGIGAISALLAGFLLLGRRGKKDEEILDYEDEAEFLDDDGDTQLFAEGDAPDADSSGIGSTVAKGVAGAAAVGGAAAVAGSHDDDDDQTIALGAELDALDATNVQDSLDPDDTISEVDVYLAYGLHGQAEELLTKAIAKDPENAEYAMKLLQTQHAQGNGDAFVEGAESYHNRFGGDAAPDWDTIANLGNDLQPNNILFASSAVAVESVGKGSFDAPTLGDEDFALDDGEEGSGSISRDFGSAGKEPVDTNDIDLMDQSLDPAFAFDETDLEATGDFSQITNEIAAEEVPMGTDTLLDDTSLDFPGFDVTDSVSDIADAGNDKLNDIAGGLAAGGAAIAGGLGAHAASAKDSVNDAFDDALSLDDLDSAAIAANDGMQGSIAEDLTLDLDQLSGDLELDGTDLLDQTSADALDDLQIPDLTSDNELLSDDVANLDGSDEMDTMMDLAKAYIDMGDKDSASSALGEIVKSGTPAQVTEAETLLRKIS